jgi:redox-sensitive bicupin YhaK (pirin superfamily)
VKEARQARSGKELRSIQRSAGRHWVGDGFPVRTLFTPMHVWDLRLDGDRRTDLALPDGWTTALVVLKGELRVNGSEPVGEAEVGLLDRRGEGVSIEGAQDARALLLSGEPIDEPIVGQGPFVMNSAAEIRQALADYESGKLGRLGA